MRVFVTTINIMCPPPTYQPDDVSASHREHLEHSLLNHEPDTQTAREHAYEAKSSLAAKGAGKARRKDVIYEFRSKCGAAIKMTTATVIIKMPQERHGWSRILCCALDINTRTLKRYELRDVQVRAQGLLKKRYCVSFKVGKRRKGDAKETLEEVSFCCDDEPDFEEMSEYLFSSLEKVAQDLQEARMLDDAGANSDELYRAHGVNAATVDTSRGAEYERNRMPLPPPPPPRQAQPAATIHAIASTTTATTLAADVLPPGWVEM